MASGLRYTSSCVCPATADRKIEVANMGPWALIRRVGNTFRPACVSWILALAHTQVEEGQGSS